VKYKYTLSSVLFIFQSQRVVSGDASISPLVWQTSSGSARRAIQFGRSSDKASDGIDYSIFISLFAVGALICSLNTIHCLRFDFERSLLQGLHLLQQPE
jgi:hypothetical protein